MNSPGPTGGEKKEFLEFITSMLRLAPEERPIARDLLGASWLKDAQ
jgi:hypothetical protein